RAAAIRQGRAAGILADLPRSVFRPSGFFRRSLAWPARIVAARPNGERPRGPQCGAAVENAIIRLHARAPGFRLGQATEPRPRTQAFRDAFELNLTRTVLLRSGGSVGLVPSAGPDVSPAQDCGSSNCAKPKL